MVDERELKRIQRYIDKLAGSGVFHVRERRMIVDNDLEVGGDLSADSLSTTTTVVTTINSDYWVGNGGVMHIDTKVSGTGQLNIENSEGGSVLLNVSGSIAVSGTVDGVDISAHAGNANAHHTAFEGLEGDTGSATPDSSKLITIGAGLGIQTSASGSTLQVSLITPGTLSVSSVNNASSSHTHAITCSSDPGASSSLLKTDSAGRLKLLYLSSASNLTLDPSGDIVVNPAGNDVLPSYNYDINLGAINKKYLTLHAAELWVETLVAQNTLATIGGRILVGPTTTLTSDLSPASTTMYVKHNNLAVGDVVYMEANGKVEFMSITAGPSGSGPYSYTVTRNLDGSGANDWYAGDAVFNTGKAGNGFIDLYSLRGVKSASQAGPTIVGNVRNSGTYNDWTEHWAIGNLNGLYGYGTTTYGFAAGKYASGSSWIAVDATYGVRIMNYTTQRARWDTAGNILIGETGSGKSNFYITASSISGRRDTTSYFQLDASNSRLLFGSNVGAASTTALAVFGANQTYNSESVGAGDLLIGDNSSGKANMLWDVSEGQLKFRSGTSTHVYIDTDGALTAGPNQEVKIDEDGLRIITTTVDSDPTEGERIKFVHPTAEARFEMFQYFVFNTLFQVGKIRLDGGSSGYQSYLYIDSVAPSRGDVDILAAAGSNYARLLLRCESSGPPTVLVEHSVVSIDPDTLVPTGKAALYVRHTDTIGSTWSMAAHFKHEATTGNIGAGIVRIESAQVDNSSMVALNYANASGQRFQLRGDGHVRQLKGLAIGSLSYDPGSGIVVHGAWSGNTSTRLGNTLGIYTMFSWPGIGFNAYASSGWKYGVGSSNHYAGLIECDTTSGGLYFRVSSGTGSSGGAVSWTNGFIIGTAGAVAFPATPTTTLSANAYLDSGTSNKLYRSTSSRRFKRDIAGADVSVKRILSLKPSRFRSAIADDPAGDRELIGLIAEEVEEVAPELVTYDAEGKPEWVQYPLLSVLLLSVTQKLIRALISKGVLRNVDLEPEPAPTD